MEIGVTVDATKALKYFGALPKRLEEAMSRAIAKIAFRFEGAAKRITPVDTGRLRASIFTVAKRLSATVSTNVKYAVFVHEGTRYTRARPFMSDALKNVEGEIRGILEGEIKRATS